MKGRLILIDVSAVAKSLVVYNNSNKSNGSDTNTCRYHICLNGHLYYTDYMFALFQIFKKISNLNLASDKLVFCCDRPSIRSKVPYELVSYLVDNSIDFTVEDLATLDAYKILGIDGIVSGYKAGRNLYDDSYYTQMADAESELDNAGYTVLYKDGYEADDIIKYLIDKNITNYTNIEVYCNDSDLGNVIDPDGIVSLLGVSKYGKHVNYASYESIYKIPYNTLVLYKATVGDHSDKIKGVHGFGPKSFGGVLEFISAQGIKFSDIRSNNLEESILRDYFKLDSEKLKQALYSLFLAKPMICTFDADIKSQFADKLKTCELLSKYRMSNLISWVQ